jgi:hypothetical protein
LGKARTRRRAQARASHANPEQRHIASSDRQPLSADDHVRTTLRRFIYDPRNPIPSGFVAMVLLIATNVGGVTSLGRYALCPQTAVGQARIALGIAEAGPIGFGLMTMTTIAFCLALPAARQPVITGAIRVAIAQAGLGALYGTMLIVAAAIHFLDSHPPCQVDLLQAIGNGATWGTFFGFGFGVLRLTIAMASAAKQTPDPLGKMWLLLANFTGLIAGWTAGLLLIQSLTNGHGWPP